MTVPRPINWRAIENALQFWATDSTGAEAFWSDQSAPQGAYPFVTLKKTGGIGGTQMAEQRWQQDGSIKWRRDKRFNLSVQAHVGPLVGGAPGAPPANVDPEDCAWSMIDQMILALALPRYQERFQRACLAIQTIGDPNDLALTVGGQWISRVQVDIVCATASVIHATEQNDATGWFDRVHVTGEFDNSDLEIDTIIGPVPDP